MPFHRLSAVAPGACARPLAAMVDWTPAKEVSPIDDFFSDTLGCSPSSMFDAVGAPAEVMASPSLTVDSLNTSLNMTPEDVKRSMRQALSSKRSYKDWTLNLSLPEATERKPKPAKARSTSRGGASTVSWSCVDSEAAGQSGKKSKDSGFAQS